MMVLGGIVSRCFSDFDLAGFGRACVLCAQRESVPSVDLSEKGYR
jgi:hypothetical protein